MRFTGLPPLAALLLGVLSVHCTHSPEPLEGAALNQEFEQIVVGRAAIEFPCAQGSLSVVDMPGYAYRVTGCGFYATYECDYDDAAGDSSNSVDNYWIYTCDRAAQDNPEKVDAGTT
jgi:hypothetical protein